MGSGRRVEAATVEVGVRRKWTQHNVTVTAGVVVLAMALLAAVVVVFVMTQPRHSTEVTSTYWDTGVTTTSTVPVSVPAEAGGITEDQVKELLAAWSGGNMSPDLVTVGEYVNLGDWAVARVYSRVWKESHGDGESGAVFQKTGQAWFVKGWVLPGDAVTQAIALADMYAPKSVWQYFGVEPGSDDSHVSGLPEQMPRDLDFAFVAEWGVGRMNTLDAIDGYFTKDLVSGSPAYASTELVLTDDERRELYRLLRALEPWSYPDVFDPPYNDAGVTGTEQFVTPAITYHLQLFVLGTEKNIWWTDDNASTTPGAQALRAWFRTVMELVQNRPEYKAMPQARGGYA